MGCVDRRLSLWLAPIRRWYDPLKKETNLNAPALKKWLANGAQPSDTVRALLQKAYVIEPNPIKVCEGQEGACMVEFGQQVTAASPTPCDHYSPPEHATSTPSMH